MSIYQQQDLDQFLQTCKDSDPASIYLVHGDRFLCQQLVDQLLTALLPAVDKPSRHIIKVDGENENQQETITSLKTWPLFAKRQIILVNNSRLFGEGSSQTEATALITAINEELPPGNILVLTAEKIDKRKKLYKEINKHGVIFDLSVASGSSKVARQQQDGVISNLINNTLTEMGKKAGPGVLGQILERVGFHPVAAVRETEKLALFCQDRDTVKVEDVAAIINRTREDAIYELNEAVTSKDLGGALLLAARLQDDGIHPLALVAGLRNLLRKLLFIRAIQELENPPYQNHISFPLFQKKYLAALKDSEHGKSPLLSGHPYSIFMTFRQAENFSLTALKGGLKDLLATEYRLKGSNIPAPLLLDGFFFKLMGGQGRQENLH